VDPAPVQKIGVLAEQEGTNLVGIGRIITRDGEPSETTQWLTIFVHFEAVARNFVFGVGKLPKDRGVLR
jgi:hypothetical protein